MQALYDDSLIRPREAAEILQISAASVYRLLSNGRLPAIQVGPRSLRIRRADLDQFIDARVRLPTAEA